MLSLSPTVNSVMQRCGSHIGNCELGSAMEHCK